MTSCCRHRLCWITCAAIWIIIIVHIFSVYRLAKHLPERRMLRVKWQTLNEKIFGVDGISGYGAETIRVTPSTKSSTADPMDQSTRMRFKYNYTRHVMQQIFDRPYLHRHLKLRQKLSGLTLVTALLDIGRGGWWEYRRPYDVYLKYLENLLRLNVNLIIFVDPKSVELVYHRRKLLGFANKTKVIPFIIRELPLFRYRHRMHAIITGELYGGWWLPQWDAHMRSHPEAKSVQYNLVVNSKPYFVYNASLLNPFRSEFFVWLDAGYGHGNRSVFPADLNWQPTFPEHKITVIKLTPQEDDIGRYELDDLYRKDRAVISGGFLAGDLETVQKFYRIYAKQVWTMLERRMIDDDQTVLVQMINAFPYLFNVVHGGWFDAFRLFPSSSSSLAINRDLSQE